eukprot:6974744-Alexandrium_andersonii.AAC.1
MPLPDAVSQSACSADVECACMGGGHASVAAWWCQCGLPPGLAPACAPPPGHVRVAAPGPARAALLGPAC